MKDMNGIGILKDFMDELLAYVPKEREEEVNHEFEKLMNNIEKELEK